MSALVLRLRAALPAPLDAAPLQPARFAGLAPAEIARTPLRLGNREVPLGELFDVTGDPASGELVIEGGDAKLDRLAAGLAAGTIRVLGDVGDELAREAGGGRIEVEGSAGAFACTGMREGTVVVRGDVGPHAASRRTGLRWGMQGGVLWVEGRLGDFAGERMRRGIVVAGSAGARIGTFLSAGTILVRGAAGPEPGFGLRRGSLILLHPPAELPPTFVDCGVHRFLFTELLVRELEARALPSVDLRRRFRRHLGCTASGGRGEILIAEGT